MSDTIDVRVARRADEAQGVVSLRLERADGAPLPAFRDVRLMPIDDSDFRVTLEKPARADETIWAKAEEKFGDRTPLSEGYVVTRAKIAVKLAQRPGGDRRRTLTLTITWPHGCDLKDRTAAEQMIGEKYLRRWGILVDDLQLFDVSRDVEERGVALGIQAAVQQQRRVAAVVDDQLGPRAVRPGHRLLGAPPVLFECLSLPGEHRNAARGDGCGSVVLCGEDVTGGPAYIRT